MENKKMNVMKKLTEARVRLQNTKLKKSGRSPFTGVKYFELVDFLPSVNKIFGELKLCSALQIKEGIAILKIMDSETNASDFVDFSCPFGVESVEFSETNAPDFIDFSCRFVPASVEFVDPMQDIVASVTYFKRILYMMALEIPESIAESAAYDNSFAKDNT